MLKLLELFGGIGACTQALKNLKIDFEIADYVEIDKYAVKSYNAINSTTFEPQDIKTWDKNIDVDLIMHGSPCQDFSIAGKGAGGDLGSGTRSSLMYETLRIVEKLKPKYIIFENVKNLLSKKHKHNFESYITYLDNLGYNSYYKVLNTKDYGVPQNRERIYCVSIRKDIDNYIFKFPEPEELQIKLKDLLEENVEEKYYLSDNIVNKILSVHIGQFDKVGIDLNDKKSLERDVTSTIRARYDCGYEHFTPGPTGVIVKNNNKQGYDIADVGDSINLSFPNSTTRRGRVGHQVAQTIQTSDVQGVVDKEIRIRKLTPKECWRLMKFDDTDFEKAEKVNSNTQLYKQAGNSIVVKVLEKILNNLLGG